MLGKVVTALAALAAMALVFAIFWWVGDIFHYELLNAALLILSIVMLAGLGATALVGYLLPQKWWEEK